MADPDGHHRYLVQHAFASATDGGGGGVWYDGGIDVGLDAPDEVFYSSSTDESRPGVGRLGRLFNGSSLPCFGGRPTDGVTADPAAYCNETSGGAGDAAPPGNYWALILLVFPLLTVFGNVLVVLSVYRERSLQSVTNYFIVSLAVADIMVAMLVMPLAVYVEVSEWLFIIDIFIRLFVYSFVCLLVLFILFIYFRQHN